MKLSTVIRRVLPAALTVLLVPGISSAQEEYVVKKSIAPGVTIVSNAHNKAIAERDSETMILEGEQGVYNAPLAPTAARSIEDDWLSTGKDPDAMYWVNPEAAQAVENTLNTGILDPMLEPYLEPLDGGGGGGELEEPMLKGSCSDRIRTKTKAVNLNFQEYEAKTDIGPFTGTLGVEADITGSANVILKYRVKRFRLLFWCVSYWVKFEDIRAYGNADIDGDFSLDGSISNINNPWKWEWQLAKPYLGSINFWVGPVPVHIGFKLPITAGLQLGVSASAGIRYTVDGNATGSFDYTCKFSGCSGSSSFNSNFVPGTGQLLYDISGRADIRAWLQLGVRAYLWSESIAYAQVGVRPQLFGDLWGYYGTNCGDRDGDGTNETVDALTMDLDWQIFITGQAGLFGSTKKWDDLWHTNKWHIAYWDLIGSDAIKPILNGPTSPYAGSSTLYRAQMGSCWPYSDMMTYNINWGDGTSSNFTNTPSAWKNLYKTWSSAGNKSVALKAVKDSHGRNFNKVTNRTISVTTGSGGGGGGGGGTADPPLVSLKCLQSIDSSLMSCFAGATGGVDPYAFYWSEDDSTWSLGSPKRNVLCPSMSDGTVREELTRLHSVRVKAKGADGQWSNIATRWCDDRILQ